MVVKIDKRMAKLFACLTIVLFLFTLSGCLTRAIEGDKEGAKDPVENTDELVDFTDVTDEDPAAEDTIGDELTDATEGEEATTGDVTGTSPTKKVKVTLYFSDKDGKNLVAETREISGVEGLARATMEELIKGPQGKDLKPTIPEGTKLLDINIKADGKGIVDLSRDLKSKHSGGSTAELLTIYSIVNTFAQFDTVDEVQILVGSQKVDSLAGHVELTKGLKADESLVK